MDEHILAIAPGEELPTPGQTITVGSALTEAQYEVKVKRITGLRWHSKNNKLIVEFTGIRRLKEASNGPEATSAKQ